MSEPLCISGCFSLILTVIPSGKQCNVFSECAQYKTRILNLGKKKKPNQLPGLNYWDKVWFQHKDLVEILQYLVLWGLMSLASQGNLSHTLKILYRSIFKEELFFFVESTWKGRAEILNKTRLEANILPWDNSVLDKLARTKLAGDLFWHDLIIISKLMAVT